MPLQQIQIGNVIIQSLRITRASRIRTAGAARIERDDRAGMIEASKAAKVGAGEAGATRVANKRFASPASAVKQAPAIRRGQRRHRGALLPTRTAKGNPSARQDSLRPAAHP